MTPYRGVECKKTRVQTSWGSRYSALAGFYFIFSKDKTFSARMSRIHTMLVLGRELRERSAGAPVVAGVKIDVCESGESP